jgi:diguanylate cyclase (GGDEF)-like protein/PAS domain S-box-containing protein
MLNTLRTLVKNVVKTPEIPPQYAAHIRGEQIAAFKTFLPFGIAATAINASIVCVLSLLSGWSFAMTIWTGLCAILLLMSIPEVIRVRKSENIVHPRPVSHLRRPSLSAFAMGILWACAPLFVLPTGTVAQISLVLTVSAGMMCGGAYIFSTVPRAAAIFVGMIGAGTVLGLLFSRFGLMKWPFMIVVGCYVATMWKAAYWNYANFVRNWLQKIAMNTQTDELVRQNEVINMLLKDFEDSASDCLWEANAAGTLTHTSSAFASRLNADTDNVIGQKMADLLIEGGADQLDVQRLHTKVRRTASFSDQRIRLEKDGVERWLCFNGKRKSDGGFRGIVADITDAYNAEKQISNMAHFDSLTDLANRDQLDQRLSAAIEQADRQDRPFAVLCLDLDRFKTINDLHGHYIGDNVLRICAERMRACLGDNDIAGRVGGDEFMILVQSQSAVASLETLTTHLIEAIEAPIQIGEIQVQTSTSIGAAIYPDHADSSVELIKSADLALYRAKHEGRARANVYDKAMDNEMSQRRLIEANLRTALVNGEFRLVYQPLIDSQSRKAVGFETLLRWDHPTEGPIPPESFINIAEQTGMIGSIGEWVIREATQEAAHWPDKQNVSVNLSPMQVKDPRIVQTVMNALASSGLEPNRLEFEVTEMVLLDDSENSMKTLADLHSLGVRISLDDFGTGYSSLTYLRSFPFDKIKIDKSFIQSIDESHECRAIVRALVGLATNLGIRSTAEGVETSAQIERVLSEGCSELQGFYFSRPQTAETLEASGLLRRTPTKTSDTPIGHATPKLSPPAQISKKAPDSKAS